MTTKDAADAASQLADESIVPGSEAASAADDAAAAQIWAELAAARAKPKNPDAGFSDDDDSTAAAMEAADRDADAADRRDEVAPQVFAADDAALWAAAPPELKAAHDKQVEALNRAIAERASATGASALAADHKVASIEGRIAAHRRKLESLYADLREPQTPASEATKAAREKLAAAKDEYPEFAQPVHDALAAIDDRVTSESERRRSAAQTELSGIIAEETARLKDLEPDWEDVLKQHGGQKFIDWVEDQPRRIREAFAENRDNIVNHVTARDLVAAYKAHLGIAPAASVPPQQAQAPANQNANPPLDGRRARQLDAAAAPRGRAGPPLESGIPKEGDPEMIWKQLMRERERKAAARRR